MTIHSPEELAHAVNDRQHLKLTPRPWNMYQAGDTLWWLVPSGDWPAYQHGKLAFSLAKDDGRKPLLGINDVVLETDTIFAGFHIEKGYGKAAIFVNPALSKKPAEIMNPSWVWWNVIGGDGPLQFANTLRAASTSGPLHLYVVASYVHDRDSTAQHARDAVVFTCTSDGIDALLHNHFPVGVLSGTEHAKTFPALAAHLGKIDDYHWVDVLVGRHVSKGEIDVGAVYRDTLSYFDHWVVPAQTP